jgi:folate-dependent phosphoribosylglycinamide formyltransferase PurN
MITIGLLTNRYLTESKRETLIPILNDNNFLIKVAVIDIRPQLSLSEKVKKNIKRGRGGYIIILTLKKLFSKKNHTFSTIDFCRKNNIDIIEVTNPYSDQNIEKIKEYNLDLLILLGGFGIIKKKILEIPIIGVLSFHHGDMRKYRGMPPGFWELYFNEKEMGITVQILSEGLDCGIPIVEKKIQIGNNFSLKKLREKASKESHDMLYIALLKLSEKDFEFTTIEKFGKIYTLPNLNQWLELRMKIIWRRFFN